MKPKKGRVYAVVNPVAGGSYLQRHTERLLRPLQNGTFGLISVLLNANKIEHFSKVARTDFKLCNFSICSGRPAASPGNFFQYGQNLPLRAPNSDPHAGSKMSVSLSTNRLQSTIYAVRVAVSRPKLL